MTITPNSRPGVIGSTLRRRSFARRSAAVLAVAGGLMAALSGPATAQGQHGASALAASATGLSRSRPQSAAGAFCAHFSVSKVSSTVGTEVYLFNAVAKGRSLECEYYASKVGALPAQVVISRQTAIPASQLKTLKRAEARIKSMSPGGVKITFTALPKLGPTAFSWTYTLHGGRLVAVANNKGTTGYGTLVGGNAKTFGNPSKRLGALERLLSFDMAA
jgi:hypothetical protein